MKPSLFFLLLLPFIISSCSCPSDEEGHKKARRYSVPDADKQSIAYRNINKITYLLNGNSTITLQATDKSSYPDYESTSYEDCEENHWNSLEVNNYVYSSNSPFLSSIRMFLRANALPENTSNMDLILHRNDGSTDSCTSLGGNNEHGYRVLIGDFPRLDFIKTSFDSTYYNIYIIPLFRYAPSNSHASQYVYDTAYYSFSKGIVKIKDFRNNVFELVSTE